MGGRGSGRYQSRFRKRLVEEHIAIDLVALRRAGVLDPLGDPVAVTWTNGGGVVVRSHVQVRDNDDGTRHLHVHVATRDGGEDLSETMKPAELRCPIASPLITPKFPRA